MFPWRLRWGATFLLFGWVTGWPSVAADFISSRLATYERRAWTQDQGLPDGVVNSVFQTRDGYLWLATGYGLVRFDGLQMTHFYHGNTPEMRNDICLNMAEDTEGGLWIGTWDGLLRFYRGAFRRWTTAEGLVENQAGPLCASRAGGIWLGDRTGLTYLTSASVTHYSTDSGLVNPSVRAVFEDAQAQLWVDTEGGLQVRDPRSGRFSAPISSPGRPKIIVDTIRAGPDGALWFADSAGLFRYRKGRWDEYPAPEPLVNRGRPIFAFPDRAGNVWYPRGASGVGRWRESRYLDETIGLAGANACYGFEGRDGALWFGTEGAGLRRFRPRWFTTLTKADGLADDNAWTVLPSRAGSVWIGTDGGLSQFQDGRFHNYTEADGLNKNTVRALAEDAAGRLWVGCGHGLDSLEDGRVLHHPFSSEPTEDKTRAICVGREGTLWVSTLRQLFANRADQCLSYGAAEGLGNGDVRELLEDRSGALWAGTFGAGLCRIEAGKITTLTKRDGLCSDFIRSLYQDHDGVLWIGTAVGLNRYERGRLASLTIREGLLENAVNAIIEDDLGSIWLGADHGIYQVRKFELNQVAAGHAATVRCVGYDETDGLLSGEVNGEKSQPTVAKTPDGRLWFPTPKGVVVIDPRRLREDDVAPRVVIEQARADERLVYSNVPALVAGGAAPGGGPNGNPWPQAPTIDYPVGRREAAITLPPGSAEVLEFHYTANSFLAPQKIRFKYRLDGADQNWHDAGFRRTAYYTNLRPGNYRFEVVAANEQGHWSMAGAGLELRLEPRLSETWWFRVGVGLSFMVAVFGLIRGRMDELRKIERLQAEVALATERVRIAKDLHDGLGADLTQISLLAEMADAQPTHERLPKLARAAREAARRLKEVIWAADPASEPLDRLVPHLCHFAEDFLAAAGVTCRFELPEDFPALTVAAEVRHNLLFATREVLNNIVKHAGATEVRVRAAVEGRRLKLTITDNGRGFRAPELAESALPAVVLDPGGRGLRNLRARMTGVGGGVTIESGLGRGTTVELKVPLA